MCNDILIYYYMFIFYSVLGWCVEVLIKYTTDKRFINRGFLIGPYLPIYGFGTLLITLLLQKYHDDPIALFLFSVAICSILEYSTSYIFEKIFKARWWDYSEKKLNINGRICLEFAIQFGIAGVLAIKIINPVIVDILNNSNKNVSLIIGIIIFIIGIVDTIVSSKILLSIRRENKGIPKDNTEQLSKKVIRKIKALGWGQKRLLSAFPKFKYISTKINETKNKAVKAISKKKNSLLKKKGDK